MSSAGTPPLLLAELGANLPAALERINVPAFVVDRDGRIRWANSAANRIRPMPVGELITRVIAPEERHAVRQRLARKLLGVDQATDYDVTLLDEQGRRVRMGISSVPLERDDCVVGVFGLALPRPSESAPKEAPPTLTPRQHEVLRLLADAHGTADIASELGISIETVRNHIRSVMHRLGTHSRLETVVHAHRLGLV